MTLGEFDAEIGDESVDVVVPLDLQGEGRGEGQVLRLYRVDIHLLEKHSSTHISIGWHHRSLEQL